MERVQGETWCLVLVFLFANSVAVDYDHLRVYKSFQQSDSAQAPEISEEYFPSLRHRRDVKISNQSLPVENETHTYYHSQLMRNGNDKYWMELSNNTNAVKDDFLSGGSLRARRFDLKFTFPYYGHPLRKVWITTGGFLYVGDVETTLKMKVMYIAPLMAFFDTSIHSQSSIFHFSNESQFTVQWTSVQLQNKPQLGQFTFQCTLYKDGKIVFSYKDLAVPASQIPIPKEHHVKVGISDAFIGYRWYIIRDMVRKVRVFYIYHYVNIKKDDIKSGSSLLLTPLPNCVIGKDCIQCMNLTGTTSFKCGWCSKLNRCSDGLDRHRVEWLDNSCNTNSIDKFENCPYDKSAKSKVYSNNSDKKISGATVGAIVGILLVVIIIAAVGGWCFYAYTHPVSRSGLFLIDLRRKPRELFQRANTAASSTAGATMDSSKA